MGLIHDQLLNITESQRPFARTFSSVKDWQDGPIDLETTLHKVQPTILIGCSGRAGAFTEHMIKDLCQVVERPIIFPLSNPNECVEACPQDLIEWTQGQAHIATGSPFSPVHYSNRQTVIGQCNNALVFPGLGLAMSLAKPKHLSDNMLWAATQAIVDYQNTQTNPLALLPSIEESPMIAKHIAMAVIKQAIQDQLSDLDPQTDVPALVEKHYWEPPIMPIIFA